MNHITEKIKEIESKLPAGVKLVAVSKLKPVETLMQAYEGGFRRFGENYVQELAGKFENMPKDVEWHMIGHLQSNKVKYIAPFVSMIHSVDSFKLLVEINKQAAKNDRVIDCLLQVHIAEEDTKTGMTEEELLEIINSEQLKSLKNVHILGLMGMSTFTDDLDQVRREFKSLKKIFDDVKSLGKASDNFSMNEISMGMSGDWPLAIEEGSTMIRVGSAIFGDR
jgi:pyridoxal phosphate enzyme (YggS family)